MAGVLSFELAYAMVFKVFFGQYSDIKMKAAREKKGLTAEELADIFYLKEWHITEIE